MNQDNQESDGLAKLSSLIEEKNTSTDSGKEVDSSKEGELSSGEELEGEEFEVLLPRLDSLGRAYATGKRKESVARVWLKPGEGNIEVNKKGLAEYFKRDSLCTMIRQPLQVTDKLSSVDIRATIKGGGLSGQAGAVRHGIAKALLNFNPLLRPALKQKGLLTRDSRIVERKKYGRRKARRSFQFSKR